jgi:exportin-1
MRNVAEIGLNILLNLLQKFASNDEAGTEFFSTYFLDLMQHIFSVVTDTSHTASEWAVACCVQV